MDKMDKKEKIQLIFVHALITTVIVLVVSWGFNYFGSTLKKVNTSASIDYVDKQNKSQDESLKKIIDKLTVSISLKADKTYVDDENRRMYEILLIIDGRVYDLWAKANGYNNRGAESKKK